MRLSMLNLSDKKEVRDFIRFNKRVFPVRKNVEKRFFWQYIDNPFLKSKKNPYVLLYCDDKGRLIGQSLLNPVTWWFRGKKYQGNFGCDYYVLEESRGASGAALAFKTIKDKKDYFAIGVSEVAQKIWKSLGVKIVGRLNLFVWFKNPFVPLRLFKKILFKSKKDRGKCIKLPEKIKVNGTEFRLMDKIDEWKEYYWKNTLQFSRSLEFLKWRFFDSPNRYCFYLADSKPRMYFVLRKCFLRGMEMLLLVDYMVPHKNSKLFETILRASKMLARKIKCYGIIAGSSHVFFDTELKKSSFVNLKRGGVIMTNTERVNLDGALKDRDIIYATSADSDYDLNFEESVEVIMNQLRNKITLKRG